jgi:hypothetical protein
MVAVRPAEPGPNRGTSLSRDGLCGGWFFMGKQEEDGPGGSIVDRRRDPKCWARDILAFPLE